MRLRIAKIRHILLRNEKKVLFAMIAAYVIIFSAASLFKLAMNLYDGIDLAYFNQVFWNTVRGRFFVQSIHPHLSLGDHAEFAILALVPFYAIRPGPETLLVLQTIVLGLSAWPIVRIARRRFGEKSLLPLLFALAWLANPSVQSINLFEFHILPFALLPLLFALDAYDAKKKWAFIVWMILSLLIREDVALVICAIGVLAWAERRPLWWRLVPITVGIAWFAAAMRLIAAFSPGGAYKYLVYYGWIGDGPLDMLRNSVTDPLRVVRHVLSVGNLEMALGFLMPLLFLPLAAPKRLVLLAGPLLQILLALPGGGSLVLETHYATLFLPAIFLAGIEAVRVLENGVRFVPKRPRLLRLPRTLIVLLLSLSIGYAASVMGPIPDVLARAASGKDAPDAIAAADLLSRIPSGASVAASYALLPRLSSREKLASLHYGYLGVTQFADGPYRLPEDLRYIALDLDDLLTYPAQFLRTAWSAPYYAGGNDRIGSLGARPVFERGRYVLLEAGAAPARNPAPALVAPTSSWTSGDLRWENGGVSFHENGAGRIDANLAAIWGSATGVTTGVAVRLEIRDSRGDTVYAASFPIETSPFSRKDRADRVVTSIRDAPIGGLSDGIYYPRIVLERENALVVLDGIRATVRDRSKTEAIGVIDFPAFSVE